MGIGTPLLGDRWVTELASKERRDQNHPDNRTRCIDFAGYKVTSCVIFVRFVSVNKLWGKGLRSGLEKVFPTFRPKFPPVPRLAQPIGSHEEKIWTTEKLLQVLKRTFQQKMWGQVHSSDKKSNGEASFMESVYLLAEHWTSHAGSSSGGIFADLLHLLLLPLAIPDCTGCTSQKVGTTTTVCCTLLQVTRLHMLHISKSRNHNKSNRFLYRLKPQKEQEQQQQVYASLHRMQHAIQNVNWYCFTPVSFWNDGVSINYRMESARIENAKVLNHYLGEAAYPGPHTSWKTTMRQMTREARCTKIVNNFEFSASWTIQSSK